MAESDTSERNHPNPRSALPKPLSHRVSAKWVTLEALRVLQDRMTAMGMPVHVMLFTTFGIVQGRLTDFAETYEHSVSSESWLDTDPVSAVVHLRTDLWSMYAEKDEAIQPGDSSAVLNLEDVSLQAGTLQTRLHRLGVFASDVAGFTLVGGQVK